MSPALLVVAALAAAASVPRCPAPEPWPLWSRYAEVFIAPDGRVIEPSAADRTTSEGQAYALFFALVAGDRARFDRLLAWTRDNLAEGDLRRRLPGWLFGRDGRQPGAPWRRLDAAPASDADLWLAYTLLEAAQLWSDPALDELGRAVLGNVVAREVITLPGWGPMLLPGPVGFEPKRGQVWRLNPSYLPLQVVRRFAALRLPGPWAQLAPAVLRLVRETAGQGFAPDWVGFARGRGFFPDPVSGPVGSYDAIRVYLWAGMLAADEPLRRPLLGALEGPARWLDGHDGLPEKIDRRARPPATGAAPPGFYAALLPGAQAAGHAVLVQRIERRLEAALADGLYGQPPAYYDQNLALFARGFVEGRFRFDRHGALVLPWGEGTCAR